MTKLNELPRPGRPRPHARRPRPGLRQGQDRRARRQGPEVALRRRHRTASRAARCRCTCACPSAASTIRSAKHFAEVNLWRIEQAIEAGKLDAKKPIDAAALMAAGVIRRARDGVRLLGNGRAQVQADITVHSATASAKAAVEKAGGAVTETRKPQRTSMRKPERGSAPAASRNLVERPRPMSESAYRLRDRQWLRPPNSSPPT